MGHLQEQKAFIDPIKLRGHKTILGLNRLGQINGGFEATIALKLNSSSMFNNRNMTFAIQRLSLVGKNLKHSGQLKHEKNHLLGVKSDSTASQ